MSKRELSAQEQYNAELKRTEKLKPADFPWWMVLLSAFMFGLTVTFISLVFKIGLGALPTIIIGAVAIYMPKTFWTRSNKYLEKFTAYTNAKNNVEAQYKDILNKAPEQNGQSI